MPHVSSRPMRMMGRAMIPGLLLALGACASGDSSSPAGPAIAPTNAAPATTPDAAPAAPPFAASSDGLAALIQSSGVRCTDPSAGRGCTAGDVDSGDFYDVELSPDCGEQGFLAGVADAKGVKTLDTVPTTGSKAMATARLLKGQLVCVQGIGRAGQNPMFYYVVAIPAATVGKCKDNALCDTYGDRPISGLASSGQACHAAGPGQYAGNCARGWVSADVLDVFSSGM